MTILFALLFFLLPGQVLPQQAPPQAFNVNCAGCHGEDARGTAKGVGLAANPRVAAQSAEQLRARYYRDALCPCGHYFDVVIRYRSRYYDKIRTLDMHRVMSGICLSTDGTQFLEHRIRSHV